jgi:hypothetical protein
MSPTPPWRRVRARRAVGPTGALAVLLGLALVAVFGASFAVGRAPRPIAAYDPTALTPIRHAGSPSALAAIPAGTPAPVVVEPMADFPADDRSFAPRPDPSLSQAIGVIIKPTPTPRPTPRPQIGSTGGGGSPSNTGNAVTGTASWYCLSGVSACHYQYSGGMYAAAGPALRVGAWRGRTVRVCSGGRCVNVKLIDWCQCYGSRVIDLYSDAFRQLGSLSSGTIRVTVSW